jgi:Opioid growth factor receptor (OGFr) conserved region
MHQNEHAYGVRILTMTAKDRSTDGRRLLDFYSGPGRDDGGRTLAEILAWDDMLLEQVHDYIQWVFPLPERSGANPEAPVLDAETITEFRAHPALQGKLRQALLRMLEFYGLEVGPEGIVRAGSFEKKAGAWLQTGNHNHLRLTRILRSLRVLGLEQDALSLFRCLSSVYEEEKAAGRPRISARTFEFWAAAVAK